MEPSTMRLQFGAVTLIPSERVVLKDGQPVSLAPKAFDLLAFFAAHPGRLLTKDELMQAVWPDAIVEESNLAYHVFSIRKALGEVPDGERYIQTVPKRGYRFVPEVLRSDGNGSDPRITPQPSVDAPAADARRAEGQTASADMVSRPVVGGGLSTHARWRAALWLAAGMAIGTLLTVGINRTRADLSSPPSLPLHFQEPVWGRVSESSMFSISPDGRHLVLATEGDDGVMRLWDRDLSASVPSPLAGGEADFSIVPPVFWSPDSRFLVTIGTHGLKKVSLAGGAPQTICEPISHAVGGSWNREGRIIVGNGFGGLMQCAAAGGPATPVMDADRSLQESHLVPSFLSDGRRFIYLRIFRSSPERSGLYVQDLQAPMPDGGKRLLTTGFSATYVAAVDGRPGLIVFAQDGRLLTQRFDEQRLELVGEPIQLADRIGSFIDGAHFAASPSTLVYRVPEPPFQLTLLDRQGTEVARVGSPEHVGGLALSPDGDRALVAVHAPQSVVQHNLWLFDLVRQSNPRRLTAPPALEARPIWANSDRFIYASWGGASGVFAQSIAGERKLLFEDEPGWVTSVSADERVVLFTTAHDPAKRFDVWVWTPDGPANGRPLLTREFDQTAAVLSPDRRWVAYVSNETGRDEVSIAPFRVDATGTPSAGESVPVSRGGGFAPRWRGDGGELFYLTREGAVMAIEVNSKQRSSATTPKRLFTVPRVFNEWGVTKDGSRFLFAIPVAAPPPLQIVRDWQAGLPK